MAAYKYTHGRSGWTEATSIWMRPKSQKSPSTRPLLIALISFSSSCLVLILETGSLVGGFAETYLYTLCLASLPKALWVAPDLQEGLGTEPKRIFQQSESRDQGYLLSTTKCNLGAQALWRFYSSLFCCKCNIGFAIKHLIKAKKNNFS